MTISPHRSKPHSAWALRLAWLVAVWGSIATVARAEEPERVIQWRAPRGCPDASAFEQRLRELNGGAAPWHVEAEIHRSREGYTLALSHFVGAHVDRRELSASSCPSLLEAAALIVSMSLGADMDAIDAVAPEASAKPVPSGIVPQRRADALGLEEDVQGALGGPPASRAVFDAFAAAGVVFDSGALPSPIAGFSGGFGISADRFGIEGKLVWLPRRDDPQSEASLRLLAAQLRLCVRLWGQKASLSVCADTEGGALRGTTGESSARGGWGAVGPTALLRTRLRNAWALSLAAGVQRPWSRTEVRVLDDATGLQTALPPPARWTARAELRTEVWF